jgi:hypothetical protein
MIKKTHRQYINTMHYNLLLFCLSCLIMSTSTTEADTNTNALSIPEHMEQPLLNIPIQQTDFVISNNTDRAVNVVDYTVACSCTTLDTKGQTVPPHATIAARAHIRRSEPYVASIFIHDSLGHWYRTDIVLTKTNKPIIK